MRYHVPLLTILIISSLDLYAAGKGSGSVKDLMFPVINFVILFGFIILKYKSVVSKGYKDESIRIENLLTDAAEADKQASLKLDSLTSQLNNIDSVKKDLKQQANEKLNVQVGKINSESKQKINKLKEDKVLKFEQEKSSLVNNANSKILDMVIEDAKSIVIADKEKKKITEQKILSAIN